MAASRNITCKECGHKGVVEAHGGKIWMEDNKPKGSRFIFTLPLQ